MDIFAEGEIEVAEALSREDLQLVDLRSPSEFCDASIPGAVNIPLFGDKEREELGTIYRLQGAAVARMKGLSMVGPRLHSLVDSINKVCGEKYPLLYCWRGGLRSAGVHQILQLMHTSSFRLKGGYRAFRKYVYRSLQDYRLSPDAVVIHGLTGSGKTMIIQCLISQGYPAIDLEELACHRGSVFGKIGIDKKRSQKDFESLLWLQLEEFQNYPFLVLEGEGRKIGNLYLPPFLVNAMKEGTHLLVEAPLKVRVERIVQEYTPSRLSPPHKEEIAAAARSLTSYLGKETVQCLLDNIEKKNFFEAACILCRDYYDRLYADARPENNKFAATFDATSVESATEAIKGYLDKTRGKTASKPGLYNMERRTG